MIDHHIHLGKDALTGFSLSEEMVTKRLDKFHLGGAVVFSCPNISYTNENPYSKNNKKVYKSSIDEKKFIPFMFVHPLLDRFGYIEREQEKFKGFKFYPRAVSMEYHYKDISNRRIIDLVSESSKPAVFHTGFREGSRIKDLVWMMKRKKSPLVFVHSGDLIERDLKIASKYENVFIDISPLATMISKNFFINSNRRHPNLKILTPKNILSHLKNLFGIERIVWGSDSPWCDNLINEGYNEEIKISRVMDKEGFNKSYLDF